MWRVKDVPQTKPLTYQPDSTLSQKPGTPETVKVKKVLTAIN